MGKTTKDVAVLLLRGREDFTHRIHLSHGDQELALTAGACPAAVVRLIAVSLQRDEESLLRTDIQSLAGLLDHQAAAYATASTRLYPVGRSGLGGKDLGVNMALRDSALGQVMSELLLEGLGSAHIPVGPGSLAAGSRQDGLRGHAILLGREVVTLAEPVPLWVHLGQLVSKDNVLGRARRVVQLR